ncbi:DUF3885 domain-containing protein [Ruminiclostridium papyrosolvens]|uniref:DUF3885 domain-containing protein n=1 Tax=Ruminiclostridium papyrosolvens C7 TaxID=1330534 RepID=U4R4Y2_9FIRM|nr:DUF3885 domain-containing protein [Ruminiclostridium papyrosolvens]EPR13453.1 hypothetical protein L323_04160 [Ruminiclostridium papyrosolvens C7]
MNFSANGRECFKHKIIAYVGKAKDGNDYMDKLLKDFLNKNYPDINHDIHVRFELGDPFPNGSDERIRQVIYRATSIFENIFSEEDYIYLVIKDWENEDPMFGNTTPQYLYTVFNTAGADTDVVEVEDEDVDGEKIYQTHKEYSIKIKVENIDYKNILTGIGNYEQGREPSIGQSIYFISVEKNVIFYMYDDRGCLVSSNSPANIKFLYNKFNDWLVEYYRKYFDSIFEKK